MKNNKLLTVFVFITLLVSIHSSAQEGQFIITLADKLETYHNMFREERVDLQIDKHLYRPGEQLWFKAYITCPGTEGLSNYSKKLYLHLFNPEGTEILKKTFLVTNGSVHGDFTLPNPADDGRYLLTAYSSWMINGNVNKVFYQPIRIMKEPLPELALVLIPDKPVYVTGDKANFKLKAKLIDENVSSSGEFRVALKSGNKTIEKEKGEINPDGTGIFALEIQQDEEGLIPELEIKASVNGSDIEKNFPLNILDNNASLRFFPEGGYLVSGLRSKVAFQLKNSRNIPVDFEGIVYNSQNAEIAKIKSVANGMGSFSFVPLKEEHYKVQITNPQGMDNTFFLPEVRDDGMTLSYLKQTSGRLFFLIQSANTNVEKINIIAHQHGKIVYGAISALKEAVQMVIPLEQIPKGIITVCIFDGAGNLVTERSVYVSDEKEIPLTIETDKNEYIPGEKVRLSIRKTDTSVWKNDLDFSLTVADNFFLKEKENLPGAYNLPIEIPHYYNITASNQEKILDLWLLSSGSVQTDWEAITSGSFKNQTSFMGMDGLSGTTLDKKGRIEPNATVRVLNLNNFEMITTQSDEDGKFYIPFDKYGVAENLLEISGTREGKDIPVEIELDPPFEHLDSLARDLLNQYITYDYGIQMKMNPKNQLAYNHEFPMHEIEKEEPELTIPDKQLFDYSTETSVLNIIKRIKPFQMNGNKIIFPGGNNSLYFQQGALIVIDGVMLGDDAGVLDNIAPSDIEDINISTNPVDVHKYSGLYTNGVIEIKTKRGKMKLPEGESKQLVNDGFPVPSDFEAPEYVDPEDREKLKDDFRTTLYWDPEITISVDGETVISFYTSNIRSEFVCRIVGIGMDGKLISRDVGIWVK